MNKKSIDKIEIFTLDFSYSSFMKDIFEIKSIDKFIDYINNDIQKDNIYLINKLFEICWYVFIDEIIINKNKFIDFYSDILKKIYNIKITNDKLEVLINDNIKKYLIEKNNINYHKIILESI
jgi:hypothetical protein